MTYDQLHHDVEKLYDKISDICDGVPTGLILGAVTKIIAVIMVDHNSRMSIEEQIEILSEGIRVYVELVQEQRKPN